MTLCSCCLQANRLNQRVAEWDSIDTFSKHQVPPQLRALAARLNPEKAEGIPARGHYFDGIQYSFADSDNPEVSRSASIAMHTHSHTTEPNLCMHHHHHYIHHIDSSTRTQLGRSRTVFCTGRCLLLDPREPPDTGKDEVRKLKYVPLGIYVQPAGHTQCVLVEPKSAAVTDLVLPDPITLNGETVKRLHLRRRGIPLREGYVVTDFFIQGMSFKRECWILHLNPPPSGPLLGSSILVCISRYPTAQELHLLAPLYHDEASKEKVVKAFQKAFEKHVDIVTDAQRLHRLHNERMQNEAAATRTHPDTTTARTTIQRATDEQHSH